jgi:iron-regulated transporter 1
MSIQSKILFSRFLTRFGDQAWDFAVPLVLIQLFPGQIQLVSFLYLFSKIVQVFKGPSFQKKIDHKDRLSIYKIGIGYQTIAMFFMWLLISLLFINQINHTFLQRILIFLAFGALSAMANLGSSLMDTSVGFDLAVDLLDQNELTEFNSRLKRLDLLTEVTAPIFTGLILSLFMVKSDLIGFTLIALLNLFTFLPEFLLLRSVPNINKGKEVLSKDSEEKSFIETLKISYSELKGKSYTPVIISYALLWLSILSPHGVLLTSYLKDGAKVSEFTIGLFRGAGAVFGLIPTFLYPILKSKMGITKASRLLLTTQFVCVFFAGISFYFVNSSIYPFLILILFSRIGLYGYSIGETELRQALIPREKRGIVNGVANSITSLATLVLFFLGTVFGSFNNFGILIAISIISIALGLIISYKINQDCHST